MQLHMRQFKHLNPYIMDTSLGMNMSNLTKRMVSFTKAHHVSYILIALVSVFTIVTYFEILPISNVKINKSDWSGLGSYFGGLLSPTISFIALLYLVRAYTIQKQELAETAASLQKSSQYHKEISELQYEQTKLMNDSRRLQQLSMQIEIAHREIISIQDDINNALACKHESARLKDNMFTHAGLDGEEIEPKNINKYIKQQRTKINELHHKIQNMLN